MNEIDRTPKNSRRSFLRTAGTVASAIPVLAVLGPTTATAETPKVDLENPSAKALEYTHESTKDGQFCNNCALWQGGDAEWGGCPIFPGANVAAKGWCKSWAKKG